MTRDIHIILLLRRSTFGKEKRKYDNVRIKKNLNMKKFKVSLLSNPS